MNRNIQLEKRYLWAARLAYAAMGKEKQWGDPPQSKAINDPLAWWCLTEAIAEGGPPINLHARQSK